MTDWLSGDVYYDCNPYWMLVGPTKSLSLPIYYERRAPVGFYQGDILSFPLVGLEVLGS